MEDVRTIEVEANGLTFTVDGAGAGGEFVLLLHGFPQTRHTWRAELPMLADAGFRAWAPDQRGISAGARPADVEAYRTELLVQDALALADAVGAAQFHVVGHDWGGQLAWIVAATEPDRVRTLSVLSRPHPRAFLRALQTDEAQSERSAHHRWFQSPDATDALLADDANRLRTMLRDQNVPAEDVDAYLDTLGNRPGLDAAINWYRATRASAIALDELPAVTVPTLYVWGTDDRTVGRPAAEGTRDFVDAPYHFVEVEGAGHFLTDERPQVFPPLLVEHLAPNAVT